MDSRPSLSLRRECEDIEIQESRESFSLSVYPNRAPWTNQKRLENYIDILPPTRSGISALSPTHTVKITGWSQAHLPLQLRPASDHQSSILNLIIPHSHSTGADKTATGVSEGRGERKRRGDGDFGRWQSSGIKVSERSISVHRRERKVTGGMVMGDCERMWAVINPLLSAVWTGLRVKGFRYYFHMH